MRSAAFLLAFLMLACIAGCRRAQTSSPPPSTDQPANLQHVKVELGQWYVKLDPSTVNAGPVHFMVTNAGNITHAFEIKGQGIDMRTNAIPAGQTATLQVTLKSGTYDAYCPIDGHKDMGMDATLTVK